MAERFQCPVAPVTMSSDFSVAGLIDARAGTSFQARNTLQGAHAKRGMALMLHFHQAWPCDQ